jgi:hypothetical protein
MSEIHNNYSINYSIMQVETNFPIILNGYRCKEVPVSGTTYYKLVTPDGLVAVLVSRGYGSDWSATVRDTYLKEEMALNSFLVQYVSSKDFKKQYAENEDLRNGYNDEVYRDQFEELLQSLIPDISDTILDYSNKVHGFAQLSIEFVRTGSIFQIVEYDGNEHIKYYDQTDYIVA